LLVAVLVATLLAAVPGVARAAPGQLERHTYANGYSSLVYTPGSLKRSRPAPLFVMVHGCNTTAEQQMGANELNAQAERDKFVVLYPEHEGDPSKHLLRCWRYGLDNTRGSSDPAAIAGMVRDALVRRSPRIDRRAVYAAGMSSGAMMTGILGATYPDLFAAIMMNAGCAYQAADSVIGCLQKPSRATEDLARAARAAMGQHARVVPALITQGDHDKLIPPEHSQQVLSQWRQTDNLVATSTLTAPISAAPLTTRTVAPPGRYPSTVTTYGPRPGCELLERWEIHGMDHFWPGGSSDPVFSGFTDPKGPDGGEIAWRFFKRFRLDDRPGRCARPIHPPRRPRPDWIGVWAASPSDASNFPIDASGNPKPTIGNSTVRAILTPTYGGSKVRVHLSNRFGTTQVTFADATIARRASGAAVVPGTLERLQFGGSRSVTVQAGQDAVSDPVGLRFDALDDLAVSVHVPQNLGDPTEHFGARQTSYLTAAGAGDAARDPSGERFTRKTTRRPFVTGVDTIASGSAGAVVALGDSLTDGAQNQPNGVTESPVGLDANVRYTDWLARRLGAARMPLSVLNAGIGGNKMLHDGTFGGNLDFFGPSALDRLDPDVLRQAGVATVILWSGINDLSQSPRATPDELIAGYKKIIGRMHDKGLRVLQATLTPFKGYPVTVAGEADEEARRQAVNAWIRTQSPADAVVDFDRAVRDPADPSRLHPIYDDGEHLHMSAAGYRRIADTVPLRELALPRCAR